MGNLEGFLINKGEQISILRTVPITSYASIQRFTRSQDPNTRAHMWYGEVLASSNLASGEIFAAGDKHYLVQSTDPNPLSELEWFGLLCNASVDLYREEETAGDDGWPIKAWVKLATSYGWAQMVTAKLIAQEPGLVDGAKYLMQLPKTLGVLPIDRLVYATKNYRVESVDDIAMEGVVRAQLTEDNR